MSTARLEAADSDQYLKFANKILNVLTRRRGGSVWRVFDLEHRKHELSERSVQRIGVHNGDRDQWIVEFQCWQ